MDVSLHKCLHISDVAVEYLLRWFMMARKYCISFFNSAVAFLEVNAVYMVHVVPDDI